MISVIIPTYNREKRILYAVESVLNQSYEDLELIVVDDCSSDNTVKLLEQVEDPRLIVIKHTQNKGACEARNTGICHAKGSFIAFQDSDDIWRNNKLQLQMDALDKYGADICISQMERFGFENGKNGIYPNISDGIIDYRKLIGSFVVSTQTIIAKREVFENTMFDPNVKRMQDYDWIVRAGLNYKVCVVALPLVEVYLQSDSITTNNYVKLIESYKFFLNKYKSMETQYPELKLLMNKCMAYAITMSGGNASKEYLILYRMTKESKYFIKYMLTKLGLMDTYNKFRQMKGERERL